MRGIYAFKWSAILILSTALMSLSMSAGTAYCDTPLRPNLSAADSLITELRTENAILVDYAITLEVNLTACEKRLEAAKESPPECEGFPYVEVLVAALAGGLAVSLLD